MKSEILLLSIIIATCLFIVFPIQAASQLIDKNAIYQTSFDIDEKWTTTNSHNYYWNSTSKWYSFLIKSGSGSYSFTPITMTTNSFTLEYDVNLTRIDEGAEFKMGLSGRDLDPTKGPNVITRFTNSKYGQIMWLHTVTPNSKLFEINSQNNAVNSIGPNIYQGSTVKYNVNKSYHVTVSYNDNTNLLLVRVSDLQYNKEIWGYYIETFESINGLDRIFLSSTRDVYDMNISAEGYIDNVKLTNIGFTVPTIIATPTPKFTLTTPIPTTAVTPRKTAIKTPTPIPIPVPDTTTAKSPVWLGIPLIAIGYVLIRKN